MLDTDISQINLYSTLHDKCKFVIKFIDLVNLFNLFPLEVVQNVNIANFVYYGKTPFTETFQEREPCKTQT